MRILLDTHISLWSLSSPSKLSASARKQINAAEVFVNAASIWEISIKCSIGTLDAKPVEVLNGVSAAGFELLPITREHAAKIAELPSIHKDPFDRMLLARATVEPMILLTNDELLRAYGSLVMIA